MASIMSGMYFRNICIYINFQSTKNEKIYEFAGSTEPDKVAHNESCYLDQHCLPSTLVFDFSI